MKNISLQHQWLMCWLDALTHQIETELDKSPPTLIVFPESGWNVTHLMGHLADWQMEGVRALRAFEQGWTYTIPNYTDHDTYNNEAMRRQVNRTFQQATMQWRQLKGVFRSQVGSFKAIELHHKILCPWCKHATIAEFVNTMLRHEDDHLQHLLKARRRGSTAMFN